VLFAIHELYYQCKKSRLTDQRAGIFVHIANRAKGHGAKNVDPL